MYESFKSCTGGGETVSDGGLSDVKEDKEIVEKITRVRAERSIGPYPAVS